eukprot:CAMPEP_0179988930 /NCGR_PEP_ID=MMETSP0984-20121128/3575_1 /TAXON_ID=483367 /ORGANISM="non described non described, Strain CCMP 2436" /LENGTH=99 /DNA_ID=CAMNT_0021907909 /DNA_START=219 /DNA_END=514 /DNA_ORIENTATION=-
MARLAGGSASHSASGTHARLSKNHSILARLQAVTSASVVCSANGGWPQERHPHAPPSPPLSPPPLANWGARSASATSPARPLHFASLPAFIRQLGRALG